MDWLVSLDTWAQAVVFGIVFLAILIGYRIINAMLKKGIKYKGVEIGNNRYLTGAETLQLIHKNNDVIEEKFSIIYGRKRRDQMEYVEKKNDYIKDIMLKQYKKILNAKKIEQSKKQNLQKAYEMLAKIMLGEQKDICRRYFRNINGSIKDVNGNELNNPKSEVNEEIRKQADWMIRKGSEIINDWYFDVEEIPREKLQELNMEIVEEIKDNIIDALKRGHIIHNEYEEKIYKLEKSIDNFAEKLFKGD